MKRFLIFCSLCAAMSACESDVNGPGDPRVMFIDGREWLYAWEFVSTDSVGSVLYQESDTILVRVVSVHAQLGDYADLILMEARSKNMAGFGTEKIWYQQSDTALVEIAYQNPGVVPIVQLRRHSASVFSPRRSFFSPMRYLETNRIADSILFREDPRVVLRFPLDQGKRWVSFRYPFLQEREVIDLHEEMYAGRYTVLVSTIATTLPEFNFDLVWHDEVCTLGLMSRTTTATSQAFEGSAYPAGPVHTVEELTLLSIEG